MFVGALLQAGKAALGLGGLILGVPPPSGEAFPPPRMPVAAVASDDTPAAIFEKVFPWSGVASVPTLASVPF